MKGGKIQASGSPLFLKDRFGLGYNLTIVVKDETERDISETGGTVANVNTLLSFVQQFIPDAKIVRSFGKEVTIRLPKGYEHTFPEAFRGLEMNRESYGIDAFGVENSSLEEVFLLLAEDGDEGAADCVPHSININENESKKEGRRGNDERSHLVPLSWLRQIGLMFWKRFIIQKRDSVGAFYSIIVPILVIGLVLLILTLDLKIVGPSIEISPETLYTSISKNYNQSDFLTGGGIGAPERDISMDAQLWSEYQNASYSNVNSVNFRNLTSSAEMSKYLLESYNYNNHNTRFGAFVFGDYVDSRIYVMWDTMNESIPILLNSTAAEQWLNGQTDESLKNLVSTLYDTQSNFSTVSYTKDPLRKKSKDSN
jgi:hypothetical protein